MNNGIKMITIYNMRLAGTLMSKGFILVGMGQNTANKRKNVFYFKDTPELEQIMKEYLEKR